MLKTFNCGVGFCLIADKKSEKIKKFFSKKFEPIKSAILTNLRKKLI